MRTPRYLPGVRNGAVAKRQGRSKNPATSKAFSGGPSIRRQRPNSRLVSSRAGDKRQGEGRGARVMWLMILSGVALATGFVFALRSQINAYRIAQAEEQLKTKLDEYSRQQKFLALDQQRALSASESERAGRWNGLEQIRLDRETTRGAVSGQRIVSLPPVKAPQGDQSRRLAADGRTESRPVDRPARTGSQAKAAKLVKGVKSRKNAKVVNVVKLNAAKREGATSKSGAGAVRVKKR
jgi:hypothetical protein